MAKQILPTDFKDDVLSESNPLKRKFKLIQNDDGTVSFEDVTEYEQLGSDFGAAQINQTNQAVNESVDKASVIDSLDDTLATTQEGMPVGALAVKELNSNLVTGECVWLGSCTCTTSETTITLSDSVYNYKFIYAVFADDKTSYTERQTVWIPTQWLQTVNFTGTPVRFLVNNCIGDSDSRAWVTPKSDTSWTCHKTKGYSETVKVYLYGVK